MASFDKKDNTYVESEPSVDVPDQVSSSSESSDPILESSASGREVTDTNTPSQDLSVDRQKDHSAATVQSTETSVQFKPESSPEVPTGSPADPELSPKYIIQTGQSVDSDKPSTLKNVTVDGWASPADMKDESFSFEDSKQDPDGDTRQSEAPQADTGNEDIVDEVVVSNSADIVDTSSVTKETISTLTDTCPLVVAETKSESGLSELDNSKKLDVDAIRRVMTDAVEATNDIKDLDSKNARKNLYERSAMGTLTEQLCYEASGAKNINEIIPNCPWMDGTTRTELQQIKSHVNMKPEVAMRHYSDDLSMALGIHKDTKIDQAVTQLWDLRSTEKWKDVSADLPPEVAAAGDKVALKAAMMDKMVMRVPSEDAPKFQEFIRKDAVASPDKYGLENSSDEEIEKLVERIKPATSDLTNHQLRLMARDIFQQKMELAGYPRGVSYAKHVQAIH